MASYGTYATLTDIKTSLGISSTDTADDARLRVALEATSRWIDNWCQRLYGFMAVTATRYLTAKETTRLLLDADLLNVTTLQTDPDGDRTYPDTWTTDDYDLLPANQYPKWELRKRLYGDYSFPLYELGVKIIGTWGHGDGDGDSPWAASGATVTVGTTSGTAVTASSGAAFAALQTILCGSEQMYITSIATNMLTVIRGVNGTTAAVQAGAAASIARYPQPVVEAALLEGAARFRRKDAPFGVTGAAEMGTSTILPTDRQVLSNLGPYRQPVVA